MPKYVRLISLLMVCSLWSMPKAANAQALMPHTLQLDATKLEKQGLTLAQEAAQLAQFQQVELALPRARLASQLAPKNEKVWLLLGGLQIQTKDFDGAIASLKKGQSINPKNADILFALGSVNFQQKNYQGAVVNYQEGLKLKPNDPEGLFDLGNTYYMMGKLPDAIAQYDQAVSQDKKFWPAINNIGLINYEQGDIPEAIKRWQSAITLDKQAAEPLLALAVALYTKGDASGELRLRQQGLTLGETALRIDSRYANLDFLKENLWGDRLLSDTKKFLELPRIQAALQQRENSSSVPEKQPTQ
ncbi:tetratricopeptide repeat protein [Nostoc sp. CHAB 5836]|uniref:tetratricopeptide repeat protein n=1 Tax=Nostoc sp. CHAB 5836 TaxID=2780404 RepID=UPI001E535635|nr:tetratricopeptide repeat protein [Nostoc sp. CHAB 5836]MCC5614729.1 tetratricopeptide repeat protein [Nostoc sp. CHAB 5836]